jgi:hypothetical protein
VNLQRFLWFVVLPAELDPEDPKIFLGLTR